jgi:glycosyltransferase involved in cell wall biosynthesis
LAPITTIKPTYLVFLGRLAPRKGATEAVHISVLAGKQLKVAAKIEEIHLICYNVNIRPGFEKYNVIYMGEIDDGSKSELLSGAIALVFSI